MTVVVPKKYNVDYDIQDVNSKIKEAYGHPEI